MTMTTREARSDEPQRRKQRDGGELTGKRLAVLSSSLDHARFKYRWINDEPSRIMAKTKEDDWDIVHNEGVKPDAVGMTTATTQVVGSKPDGTPLLAYLCRKPRRFYDEDQADKSAELDRQIEQLRRGNDRSGGSQADYIPQSGIRMG